MIPSINLLTQDIAEAVYPNKTYKIVFNADIKKRGGSLKKNEVLSVTYDNTSVAETFPSNYGVQDIMMSMDVDDMDRIQGYIDDIEAVIQTVYTILMTERYKHLIYSWDWGIELFDLFGKPMPYVMSVLPGRITDALKVDNRIEDVTDFEFDVKGKKLHTTFTVVTNVGNVSTAMEVAV